jgi:hypothetical protein
MEKLNKADNCNRDVVTAIDQLSTPRLENWLNLQFDDLHIVSPQQPLIY